MTLLSNNSMTIYADNTLSAFSNSIPRALTLDGSWSVGLSEFACTSYESKETGKPKLMFMYTDIIKPRQMGNILSRYLRVIPIRKNNEIQTLQFNPVHYCAVEEFYIENISILLSDAKGDQINFNASTTPTMVVLHFKRN